MRNITDEQATELARVVVIDHLLDGVEYSTLVESVDDSLVDSEDKAEEDDYLAVQTAVYKFFDTLRDQLESSNR